MSSKKEKGSAFPIPNWMVFIIIFIIAILIYKFVFGNPANLDEHGHALPGNYMGMIYMGGFIVPILLTLFISTWVFSIERMLSLNKAAGGKDVDEFLKKVTYALESDNIDEARDLCNNQKGSVANVTLSGINAFEAVENESALNIEQKVAAIQKEMEETTALEVPMLQKNMAILSTLASVATLAGLVGTVLGMIRSFAALATAGAPDQAALATGISEALINTALGISTSFFAIVFYNYFSSKIDSMTYKMDESQFLITQTLISKKM
jgi:biopolymer transport protein ExbB